MSVILNQKVPGFQRDLAVVEMARQATSQDRLHVDRFAGVPARLGIFEYVRHPRNETAPRALSHEHNHGDPAIRTIQVAR